MATYGADDLFAARRAEVLAEVAPLADRMRPRSLAEVVGLPALLDPGAAFRVLVESGPARFDGAVGTTGKRQDHPGAAGGPPLFRRPSRRSAPLPPG